MSNDNQKNNQESNDRSKKITRAVVVLLVIVVIIVLASGKWMKRSNTETTSTISDEGCKAGYLFSETTGKPCPAPVTSISGDATAPKTAASTTASSYDETLRAYAGKAVLFDATCKAMPATQTLPLGTRVLIANNSAQTLTLALGDRSESLDSYHYYTYSLKTPGDVPVSCNGKPAATITVDSGK